MSSDPERRPTAVIVSLQLPGVSDEQHEADIAELERLVDTLGLQVIGRVTQRRAHPRAGTVLGLGKLTELAAWTGGTGDVHAHVPRKNKLRTRREKERLEEEARLEDDSDHEDDLEARGEEDDGHDAEGFVASGKAEVVVVDHDLSPREQSNLEKASGAEVIDRTQVIVEIFHRHAKSREARLQVEIARLMYVAPRLREAGAGADRQRGGIGGKGAGESAVELDRRRIRDRIAELKKELDHIQTEQATRRALRRDQRKVALVGYTNAGKSSLMRALTGSEVYVADKLFATLDTTVRALKPETDPRILVSDTVGFIKKLPHQLVASFRSTLDEALEASLLLYLVDASDPTFETQLETTRSVLSEIGADEVPSRIVLNKRDRLDEDTVASLRARYPEAWIVSARDRDDVARVREQILAFFDGELVEEEVFVPYDRHGLVQKIHESARVLEERYDERGTHVRVRAPALAMQRIRDLTAAAS